MIFRFIPTVLLVVAATAGAQTPPKDEQVSVSAAAVAPAPSPAHLQAVGALVDALRVPDILSADLKFLPAETPAQADFMAHFQAQFGREEMRRRATVAYAALFTLSDARALAPLLRAPGAERAVRYLDVRSLRGPGWVHRPEESVQQFVRGLERSAAGKTLLANGHDMQVANWTILRQARMEYAGKMLVPSLAAVIAVRRERIASGNVTEPRPFVPPPSGVLFVDAISKLMSDMAYHSDHSTWQLEADLDAMGINSMLTPKTLADSAALPQRRATLDKIDQRIEQFLAETDAYLTAYGSALEALDMPFKEEFAPSAREGIEQQMAASVKVAENQRAAIDVMRRFLAFAESRKGKFTEHKGTLTFADQADLRAYNALVREAQGEAGRNAQLRAEATERLKKLAERIAP